MLEDGDRKTPRQQASEKMRNSNYVDLRLVAIERYLQNIKQVIILKQIIDEIETLQLGDEKSKDVVLQWIEILLQYGASNLEKSQELDYRIEIFKLYFSFTGGANSPRKTTDEIIIELHSHRGDRDFAARIIEVLLGKVKLLQRVLAEKMHEEDSIKAERARLLEEKRKYET